MPVEQRRVTAEELPALSRAMALVFASPPPTDERVVQLGRALELDRTWAAFDSGRVVATSFTFSYGLSVPGAVLPAGGLAGVTVAPTHRRRGLLGDIMGRHLDDGRARGEALACLWASEAPIYGRFGYGIATRSVRWELHARHGAFRPGVGEKGRSAAARVRLLDPGAGPEEIVAEVRPVHDAALGQIPGVIDRPDALWLSRTRNSSGQLRWAVIDDTDGRPEAYAAYRIDPGHSGHNEENQVTVTELMARTPDGYAGLMRFLLDHDLIGPVAARMRPADEPLALMLADPRRMITTVMEGMWLRLIDIGAALAGRRYAGADRLVLDVADPFLPDAPGRWVVDGGPDGASCRPTSEPADLCLGVDDLAATYLGGTSFTDLVRAGRAAEQRPGAALAATKLFAWDPLPWAPTYF